MTPKMQYDLSESVIELLKLDLKYITWRRMCGFFRAIWSEKRSVNGYRILVITYRRPRKPCCLHHLTWVMIRAAGSSETSVHFFKTVG